MVVASTQRVATMTARVEQATTATVDHHHLPRQQSGHGPLRFCLVVAELFQTARRREPQGPRPFGLVMRGMAGTLTVMAMEWGVNEVSATVPATHG